jgi:selenocysteine-specific elongation factor
MYGKSVASARPGSRVAINLAGSFKSVPERGSLLAMGGEPRSVGDFWAVANVAPTWDAGVRAGGGYIAHVGTRSIDARIYPLGQRAVESRKTSICRIVLAEPAPVEAGERFTLFSSARYGVVAGCLAIYAGQLPKESRAREIFEQVRPTELFDAETFALLKVLAEPTSVEDVHAGSLFSQGEMATAVESLAAKGIIELVKSANTQYAFGAAFLQKKSAEALESLKKVRAENPSLTSFSASTLQLARGISKGAQNAILEHIASANAELVFRNAVLSIAGAPVSETLSSPSATRVLARFRGEIADYPTLKQLYQMFPQDKRVIAALLQQGQLVRLPQDILLPPKVLSRVKSQLESLLRQNDTITVADAKDVWGVTRKHVIPLLEYFDSLGITARAGDVRRRGPNFGK